MEKHPSVKQTQKLSAKERLEKSLVELRAHIEQNIEFIVYDPKFLKTLGRRTAEEKLFDDIRLQIKEMLLTDEWIINQKTLDLVNRFLEAAAWGDEKVIQAFINLGFPVNYQDPRTGRTALHEAAGTRARDVVKLLLRVRGCDFLIRDNKGRLPSEMAYLYGHDPALARLLGDKERRQAEAQGIKLTRRPAPAP